MTSSLCSVHFLKWRKPLLLHFPSPAVPVTPFQVCWFVSTLALKSPRRMDLSVRGAAKITDQGWSLWVHRHLQLLHVSCQIREVSASPGGHLCLLEVPRAC